MHVYKLSIIIIFEHFFNNLMRYWTYMYSYITKKKGAY
jgi:hypothetical protein